MRWTVHVVLLARFGYIVNLKRERRFDGVLVILCVVSKLGHGGKDKSADIVASRLGAPLTRAPS